MISSMRASTHSGSVGRISPDQLGVRVMETRVGLGPAIGVFRESMAVRFVAGRVALNSWPRAAGTGAAAAEGGMLNRRGFAVGGFLGLLAVGFVAARAGPKFGVKGASAGAGVA